MYNPNKLTVGDCRKFKDGVIARLILINDLYYTSKSLYEKGIGVCSDCGHFVDIDYKYCKRCEKAAIIFVYKHL